MLQAAALLVTPLTVVQPILAVGPVLLLAIGEHALHERVAAREVAGVAAICAGLVVLTLAAPDHTLTRASSAGLAVALGGAALLPYLLRGLRRRPGLSVVLCAGIAFAWWGITA
jgi:drug/metabolite transporter (DMT)-like permease